MGEHLKSNDMIQHDEVNDMVSYSLESSVKVTIDRNKRRWKFLWGISCIVVILELLFLMIFRYPMDHIKSIINISGIMMIFALWACFFVKELPMFYDEHKINYVSQGIFRIYMPGLAFNNANWPVILNVLRVFFY